MADGDSSGYGSSDSGSYSANASGSYGAKASGSYGTDNQSDYLTHLMSQYASQDQSELLDYLGGLANKLNPYQMQSLGLNQAMGPYQMQNPLLNQGRLSQNQGLLSQIPMAQNYGNTVVIIIPQTGIGNQLAGPGQGYQDQLRRIQQDVEGLARFYGTSNEQAARYLMDLDTLTSSGYGQDPGSMLKDFYKKKADQDPDNKEFYKGLESLAESYSQDQHEKAA